MHDIAARRPNLPLVIAVPAIVAVLYGWAVFGSTFIKPGSIGLDYVAPGSDWMVLDGAIRLAQAGRLALTNDSVLFTQYINTAYAHWLPHFMFYRPWVYPPTFLLFLLPFAQLGFDASYAAFQAATALLLVFALFYQPQRRSAAPWIAAAVILCPAASITAIDGQCSFLVAGLIVLGLRLLPRRPILAGLVIGLLSFKPQFGLMIPIALLGARQWRAMAAAACSVGLLAGASAAMFGVQPWIWWFQRAAFSYGSSTNEWASFERMWGNSVYACAALLHAPPAVALALQIMATVVAGGVVYVTYRARFDTDLKLAVLLVATILAAPHFSTYDCLLLTIGGSLWYASLASPSPKSGILLLLLWLAPLLGPPALVPVGRLEPLLLVSFLCVVWLPYRRQEVLF